MNDTETEDFVSLEVEPAQAGTAIAEIQALAGQGDVGLTTVLLAAIGVAGGGAAWRFYSQHSRNRHAQRMKELEIMASDETTEKQAMQKRIEELEARLAKESEDIRASLASLEKKAKAKPKARR